MRRAGCAQLVPDRAGALLGPRLLVVEELRLVADLLFVGRCHASGADLCQQLVPYHASVCAVRAPGISHVTPDRGASGVATRRSIRNAVIRLMRSRGGTSIMSENKPGRRFAGPEHTTDGRGTSMSNKTATAILAGGCFWGMQDLIRKRPGVLATRVGYTGGDTTNATYRNHGTHAEAIEIVFNPDQLSYRDLLECFFQIHDPTTKNRQGNDIGASYRSAIFYTSDEQKRVAEDTIADVDASGLWPGKVVTEVAAAGPFWEAEPDHQDYLQRYPDGYTCHFPRPEWKLPKRATA